MRSARRHEPIRFVRGRHLYQIAPAYAGEEGYIGICDGRVIARGAERPAVARALISAKIVKPAA